MGKIFIKEYHIDLKTIKHWWKKSKRTLIDGEIYLVQDRKNQYSENGYTTQSNLKIQCNPYQATNSIFQRTKTNNFTICTEIQKTSNSQSNLEKEWNWRNQPAWLQALLQSHSHQDSMVLAQRQKHRSMEQNRKPRDKSTHLSTPSLTKEARIYSGEKTIYLTSGAGKTGQLFVKEWN